MTLNFRLSEDTDLHTRFFKNLLKIAELILLGIAFNDNGLRSRRAVESHFRNRKSEDCTCMESELRQVL